MWKDTYLKVHPNGAAIFHEQKKLAFLLPLIVEAHALLPPTPLFWVNDDQTISLGGQPCGCTSIQYSGYLKQESRTHLNCGMKFNHALISLSLPSLPSDHSLRLHQSQTDGWNAPRETDRASTSRTCSTGPEGNSENPTAGRRGRKAIYGIASYFCPNETANDSN